jgi:hypothetical protein
VIPWKYSFKRLNQALLGGALRRKLAKFAPSKCADSIPLFAFHFIHLTEPRKYTLNMLHLFVTGKKSTIVMRIFALILALAFAVSGQEIEDSITWAQLQIRNNIFATVQYGDRLVKVFEQLTSTSNGTKSKPSYYFEPVNLFLPQSTKCILNESTEENELLFSIVFWNEDLHQRIVDHLNDEENIANAKVNVIPFEEVIFTNTEPSKLYRPTNSWIPYGGEKLMSFKLTFDSESQCQVEQRRARSNPYFFQHFKLMFKIAARSRIAQISVDSIRKGSLFGKFEQKFPNADSVLLTEDDTKRFVRESTTEVMFEMFDYTEMPNSSSKAQVYEILEKMLIDSQVTINEQSSQLWSSVFHEDGDYPDKSRPLTVSRINLAKVRASSSTGSRDVKLAYWKCLTSGIHIASNTSLENIYWLAEMQKKQSGKFNEKYDCV